MKWPTIEKNVFVVSLAFGLGAFVFTALIAAGTMMYTTSVNAPRNSPIATILGTSGYTGYIVIQSFDNESRVMIALMKSALTNQTIPIRLELTKNFYVERQDAIIENGIVVGTKPRVLASLSELTPGTQGLASLYVATTTTGATFMNYLLIGNPFPRP